MNLAPNTDMPIQSDESWRYTPLKAFLNQPFKTVEGVAFSDNFRLYDEMKDLVSPNETLIVYYNGQRVRHLEQVGAVPVEIMTEQEAQKDPDLSAKILAENLRPLSPQLKGLESIHRENAGNSTVIRLKIGVRSSVHILHIYGNIHNQKTDGFAVYPRHLVIGDEYAMSDIVETHIAINNIKFHVNGATNFSLGKHTAVTYCRNQWSGDEATIVYNNNVVIHSGSSFRSLHMTIGGKLTRNESAFFLSDENTDVQVDGIYLGKDNHHIDNASFIQHRAGHSKSRQLYKGILGESSRSVFSGRLLIDEDAQKSDAGQLNQTMLLGDKAEIDTKPQLEVYADDVKAAHGASVGGLREEELFYLQSRAITREKASSMLAEGFLSEVIFRLDSKETQRKSLAMLRKALPEFLQGSLS